MSLLDLFAAVVLLVAVASGVAILIILGMAPGYVARRRGHPWAQAVSVAGWVTLIFGLVLWPIAFVWAYVDIPARAPGGERLP
jgi:vacuolar-type H+-ATPase subunit I/STV1